MTTERKTPERIVAEALGPYGLVGGARDHAARNVLGHLDASGLLVGDPTEEQIEGAARALCAEEQNTSWERFHKIVQDQYRATARIALAGAGVAPQEPSDRLDWKYRAETLRRKWMAAEERAQGLFEKYAEHAEHVQVEAWSMACIDGDCEHRDGFGEPEDLSKCPSSPMDVCVDCMEIAGVGRDPEGWEEGLCPWPCERANPAPSLDRAQLIVAADELIQSWDARGSWTPDSPVGMVMQLRHALAAAPVVDEAKLAEAICREIHSTRWTHRATSTQCEDCWRAAGAVAEHLRGGR